MTLAYAKLTRLANTASNKVFYPYNCYTRRNWALAKLTVSITACQPMPITNIRSSKPSYWSSTRWDPSMVESKEAKPFKVSQEILELIIGEKACQIPDEEYFVAHSFFLNDG